MIYTQQFCDEQGGISRHPLVPAPGLETMLTTIEFAIEQPDLTRVTVTWEPYGPTTAEELAAFLFKCAPA